VDQYRTEEEQVEALRRWWNENGRSTIAAIIIALSAGFGWQSWKGYDQSLKESASDSYQVLLQTLAQAEGSSEQRQAASNMAEQLKSDYTGSTYAQFAALHLARLAVADGDLAEAEAQLRWALGKTDKGSDMALVAQLRLARVLASQGDTDQALAILAQGGEGVYQASYALARGDVLLGSGRQDEARQAYSQAMMLAAQSGGQVNMGMVEQKLQSLNPVPVRELQADQPDSVEADQAVLDEAVDGSPEVVGEEG